MSDEAVASTMYSRNTVQALFAGFPCVPIVDAYPFGQYLLLLEVGKRLSLHVTYPRVSN